MITSESKFMNPTIVVSWDPKAFPFYGSFAVLDAVSGKAVRIKGAGFTPKSEIKITICEKETLLGKATANSCGAFEIHPLLPAGMPPGPVSVKAWVGGVLLAAWPLDIVKELPHL